LLPTGTVTFLFTDIEGSTRLWEAHRAAMQQALAQQHVNDPEYVSLAQKYLYGGLRKAGFPEQ
jgi:hypothetical protein